MLLLSILCNSMFGSPVPPPTDIAKKVVNQFYIYMVVFTIIAVLKMFLLDLNYGIQDLFGSCLLYCAISQLNFCLISFFLILTFFPMFQLFVLFGTEIQHGDNIISRNVALVNAVIIISLVTYVVGYYLCYIAYKEFKAITMGMPNTGYTNMPAQGGGTFPRGNRDEEQGQGRSQPVGFAAFQGQGRTIG